MLFLHRNLRPPQLILCLVLGGAVLAGLLAPAARCQDNGENLLTTTELRALERENAMWRLVRPDESVEENIARFGAAGFTPEEVAALQPRLAAMWDVPVERNFGWLHEDTVRQIREIDRQFIGRMRAVRLYAATGIRPGGKSPGSVSSLTRLWRGAVFTVLDYDEIAEFRLMNSSSAREVGQWVEGLKLSDDELRTLFEWQREFAGTHGATPPGSGSQPAWWRQEQLDQWQRIRELLGDERFAVYLSRASVRFGQMQQALVRSGDPGAKGALDLWWLRQGYEAARSNRNPVVRREDELKAETRAHALAVLGAERLANYVTDQDGRWLVTPVRQRRAQAASDRP
ncbi:MAG: hypothetical protein PSV13_10900 [Lacunisphaera sp.]|nr:hypothetical protein [Lacunisphaera sp.]